MPFVRRLLSVPSPVTMNLDDGRALKDVKPPKVKADEDLEVAKSGRWTDASEAPEASPGAVDKRLALVYATGLLCVALFAVPSEYHVGAVGAAIAWTPESRTLPAVPMGTMIDYLRFQTKRAKLSPFAHVVCKRAIAPDTLKAINRDFPPSLTTQAHVDEEDLVEAGEIKGEFANLLKELKAPWLKHTLEGIFNVSLSNTFTRVTLRGITRADIDGRIHVDDESKRVSVLVYLNEDWPFEGDGGKLRLLKRRDFESPGKQYRAG